MCASDFVVIFPSQTKIIFREDFQIASWDRLTVTDGPTFIFFILNFKVTPATVFVSKPSIWENLGLCKICGMASNLVKLFQYMRSCFRQSSPGLGLGMCVFKSNRSRHKSWRSPVCFKLDDDPSVRISRVYSGKHLLQVCPILPAKSVQVLLQPNSHDIWFHTRNRFIFNRCSGVAPAWLYWTSSVALTLCGEGWRGTEPLMENQDIE